MEVVDDEVDIGSTGHSEQMQDLVESQYSWAVHNQPDEPTEFVDPPRTLTIVIAFRKDWRVRISLRGVQTMIKSSKAER